MGISLQVISMEMNESYKRKKEEENSRNVKTKVETLYFGKLENLIDTLKKKMQSNFVEFGIFKLFSDIQDILDKELDLLFLNIDNNSESRCKKYNYKKQILISLQEFAREHFVSDKMKQLSNKQLNQLLLRILIHKIDLNREKSEKLAAQLIIAGASPDLGLFCRIGASRVLKAISILEAIKKSDRFTNLIYLIKEYSINLEFTDLPCEIHWTIINQMMSDIIQHNSRNENGIFWPLKGIGNFINSITLVNNYFSYFNIDQELLKTAKNLAREIFAQEESNLTQDELDTQLQNILKINSLEEKSDFIKIARLIIAGANPNLKIISERSISSLLIEIIVGTEFANEHILNLGLINLLIDYGADINFKDSYGKTALHYAYEHINYYDNPDDSIIHKLIDKGANINIKTSNEQDILYLAITNINTSVDLVKKIIDKGADLSKIDYYIKEINETIISLAENSDDGEDIEYRGDVISNYLEKLKLLIDYDLGVSARKYCSNNSLMMLISYDYEIAKSILKFHIEYEFDINAFNIKIQAIQDIALQDKEKSKLVKLIDDYLLIEKHLKKITENSSIIKSLKEINEKPIFNSTFNKEETIRIAKRLAREYFAVEESKLSKVELNKQFQEILEGEYTPGTEEKAMRLILAGAKCEFIDELTIDKFSNISDLLIYYYNSYFTPEEKSKLLIQAIEKGDSHVAKMLCINNVDLRYKDSNDRTPLLIAIEKGDIDMVDLILSYSKGYRDEIDLAIKIAKELQRDDIVKKIEKIDNAFKNLNKDGCLVQ